MDCVICKNGKTLRGKATVTIERGGSIIVIKDVPADICQNCGECYLDAEMTKKVLKRADQSGKKRSELEVIKMQKVA